MQQALYRRYRPEVFESILGQEHIVKILKNQVRSETIGHAYLFCGTRGTGKTTTARILAKGVNCLGKVEERPCGVCENCLAIKDGIFIDVIEIDAASHNGVENIRELRESVKYSPVKGRYKIYIIDEVHMLSQGAFNALLKTLEEPPNYVIFILATTEPSRLPATVLSRCMRLDFRRVAEQVVVESMKEICSELGVEVEESGLRLIAANGDGSVRDSLSILEKCLATGSKKVSRSDVLDALGTRGEEEFLDLTEKTRNGQVGDVLLQINHILSMGADSKQILKDWMNHYRNLMLIKFIDQSEEILNLSEENIARMKLQSDAMDLKEINEGIYTMANAYSDARWSSQPRIHLELAAARLAGPLVEAEVEINKVEVKKDKNNKSSKKEINKEANKEVKKAKLDLSELWEKALNQGESVKPSLNMLRKCCVPVNSGENSMCLEISSGPALRIAEENLDFINGLLCEISGKEMALECRMSEADSGASLERKPEELAEEIGKRFNIAVDVE